MSTQTAEDLHRQLKDAEAERAHHYAAYRSAGGRVSSLRAALKRAETHDAKATGKALHHATVRALLKKAGCEISQYVQTGRWGEHSSGADINQRGADAVEVFWLGRRFSRDEDGRRESMLVKYREVLTAAGLVVTEVPSRVGIRVTRPVTPETTGAQHQ
jgi:hypothetical protein